MRAPTYDESFCSDYGKQAPNKMSSLETHIAGSEDRLIDGLHFAGRNTASYIIARKSVTFSPSSASNWQPSGVRLMRFNLADQAGWLDASTLRLAFTLTNLDINANLAPLTDSPASMFRRLRIIANGSSVIEDIEEYSRVFQLFMELLPSQRRYNAIAENWGSSSGSDHSLDKPLGTIDPIPPDSSRQLIVTLLSPFLSQGKMLPLSMLPLTIEIELDDALTAFGTGLSESWSITRPRLLADVCEMDQALQNSYAKHLLDGKSLPLYCDGMYSVRGAIPAGSSLFSFPIARGFSRLKAIYVSFHDGGAYKWSTGFMHPLHQNLAAQNIEAIDNLKWNMQIGSDRWPSFDCESTQESWYRLRLTTKAHTGNDSHSIEPHRYRLDKFVIGQSFEKAPGESSHSGVNTRSGSQLTLNFRNMGSATTIHCILVYEQVVNVSAAGVEVLD